MANPRAFAATACGVLAAALAILALALQVCAQARAQQGYPERTVRIIVPTAAGGSIDTTARVVAAALAERWGKPVVIEKRPRAAMIIGAEAAAKSPPDGYTLLIAHDGTMAMNPVVYPNLAYHSQRDFEPLALLTSIAEVVLVNAALPVKSIRELIAFAKANPGKLNHASGGTATLLALELFKAMAEVDITNVPFRERRAGGHRRDGGRDAGDLRRPRHRQCRDAVGQAAHARGDDAHAGAAAARGGDDR
jgi:tripartite-type tricarboxylate transporter receptor subunit TctC